VRCIQLRSLIRIVLDTSILDETTMSTLMTVDHLRQRAVREDFVVFLDASPAVAPMKGDELP
jgi:hypothetical protein